MDKSKVEKILSNRLKRILVNVQNPNTLFEIRLRIHKPIILYYEHQEYFVDQNFQLKKDSENVMNATKEDIDEIIEYVSKHSPYAYEEEIRSGFITIEGGHRIGLSGKVVQEGRRIKTIRNISCINIRISHEVKGCADELMPYLFHQGRLCHSMIISPPKCGKTTLLRDIIRQLSDGTSYCPGMDVGVVDERSEIGGCYRGIPQNDIGCRTDILDGCNKSEGMLMLIRSMAPKVIAIDEIGSLSDVEALGVAIYSGCKIICTIHGESLEEIKSKPNLSELIDQKIFERFILLQNNPSEDGSLLIYGPHYALIGEIRRKRA